MEKHDALQAAKLEALRQDIAQGIASLDAGQSVPLDASVIKAKAREQRATLSKK